MYRQQLLKDQAKWPSKTLATAAAWSVDLNSFDIGITRCVFKSFSVSQLQSQNPVRKPEVVESVRQCRGVFRSCRGFPSVDRPDRATVARIVHMAYAVGLLLELAARARAWMCCDADLRAICLH